MKTILASFLAVAFLATCPTFAAAADQPADKGDMKKDKKKDDKKSDKKDDKGAAKSGGGGW